MSTRMYILGYVATVLLLIGVLAYMFLHDSPNQETNQVNTVEVFDFESCVSARYPILESFPRQCNTPDGDSYTETLTGPVEYTSEGGVLIEVNDFQPGEVIDSPLVVTGKVPGSWSFEASFPVVLVDWDGRIIAQQAAQLTSDWMTEELVPFTVTLEFETPTYSDTGSLILRKDNPSGLPEYDDALEIPVVFE